jgi:hypothetical protein
MKLKGFLEYCKMMTLMQHSKKPFGSRNNVGSARVAWTQKPRCSVVNGLCPRPNSFFPDLGEATNTATVLLPFSSSFDAICNARPQWHELTQKGTQRAPNDKPKFYW